jgi:hypothetical protein
VKERAASTDFQEASQLTQGLVAAHQANASLPAAIKMSEYVGGATEEQMQMLAQMDTAAIRMAFLQCSSPSLVGICLQEPTNDVKLYWEYSAPVQKVEVVDQSWRSGYVQEAQIQMMKQFMQGFNLNTQAPMNLSGELDRMRIAAAYQGANSGQSLGRTGSAEALSRAAMESQRILSIHPEGQGKSLETAAQGYTNLEYHVFSEPFNQQNKGKQWDTEYPMYRDWMYCHKSKSQGSLMSEATGVFLSRNATLSYMYFPQQYMAQIMSPLACTYKNSTEGVTDPSFAARVSAQSPFLAAMQMYTTLFGSGSSDFCQGKNQGPWVPVTTRINQAGYRAGAAGIAFRRGVEVAYKLQSNQFYEWTMDRDMVQWLHNDRMAADPVNLPTGPNQAITQVSAGFCRTLQQYLMEYGNMGNANARRLGDFWGVGLHWRRLRCCPPGYIPIGPAPIME